MINNLIETSKLFTEGRIGALTLPNRLVRSATCERMADDDGRARPQIYDLYRELARGGVGLIITGHMYVDPGGKANPEMLGVYSDDMIPGLAKMADVIHREGGALVAQINHGGMQCSAETVSDPVAPSAVEPPYLSRPAREMTPAEIESVVQAFGQAARRVQEAGFDGVQIHGAHGYLVNQFLSPLVNHRADEWGGDWQKRLNFLRAVCEAIRAQVGPRYPVLIKLGMKDGIEGGLTVEDGVRVVAALQEMTINGVEISGGIGGESTRKGVRAGENEAYFRPLAQKARPLTPLPLILVGGFRSRPVMEDVLASGDADFISMCRPLICEPDFPNRLQAGEQQQSTCISANRCWADGPGEGIACKCPID